MTDLTSPVPAEIDELWERRDSLTPDDGQAREIVVAAVDLLDRGEARVFHLDPDTGSVHSDERARRAIILCFRVLDLRPTEAGPFHHHDRLPLKSDFPGVRVVPGAIARWGSHLEPGVVLMPSFVNIGAHVGARTMVDTWATVGSCAQIGRDVHLSGGVGIGGVLEPAGAVPVVVEDHAFVGSRAILVEGARVRTGAKLGAGVLLTGRTRVFDSLTGDELPRGEAPAWSVCVAATYPRQHPGGEFGAPCLLVIHRLAPGETPDALALQDVFRAHDTAG
ncbi:2,3,4,5-tetrahydropyridine-2,6-dicarboxylate N-succinyltransferase [Plantactinospora endophytica]|uniref:2,3,4,5-tetrahydropyridine-2,6-dicarboxylate N-succinyltransferase n=1 Tax=Plantactinospora endophytica TaxID=673535 RepID=A0ABQ4DZK4_9ACTN|nr:2,3,4,5-tetrahydropyridine-2,6-dicarboxylate N-succinyltransferase [Plantactinospora endophytica]GIG87880.1 2,3,4,5-tetrahydropyridine-2,6-dicarboxylate N-succinyltransferase [Plantactinospora endophytica]